MRRARDEAGGNDRAGAVDDLGVGRPFRPFGVGSGGDDAATGHDDRTRRVEAARGIDHPGIGEDDGTVVAIPAV